MIRPDQGAVLWKMSEVTSALLFKDSTYINHCQWLPNLIEKKKTEEMFEEPVETCWKHGGMA